MNVIARSWTTLLGDRPLGRRISRTVAVLVRRESLAVLGLSALTAVLSFLHLGSKSLWFDEAYTYELTQAKPGLLLDILWDRELPNALHVALLQPFVSVFGTSEAALRAPSAVFATATIPLAFAVARRFLSLELAAVATLFVALNGFFLTYAQEGRSYALAVLLTTASLLAVFRAVERPTTARTCVWSLAAAAATYAHFYAGFMFAGQLLAFATGSRSPRRRRLTATAAGLYAVLIAPILVYLLVGETIRTQLGQPDLRDLAAIVVAVSGDGGPALALAATGLTVVGAFAVARRFRELSSSERARSLALYLTLVAPPALALAYGRLITPVIERRYFAVLIVPMMIAAAIGVDLGRRARIPIVVAMTVLLGWSVQQAYSRTKEDWRGAASFLAQHSRDGDGIAFADGLARTTLRYYLLQNGLADRLTPVRPPEPLRTLTLSVHDDRATVPMPATDRVWFVCEVTRASCGTGTMPAVTPGAGERAQSSVGFASESIRLFLRARRRAG